MKYKVVYTDRDDFKIGDVFDENIIKQTIWGSYIQLNGYGCLVFEKGIVVLKHEEQAISLKCIVQGCKNHEDEGEGKMVGSDHWICMPCFDMLMLGDSSRCPDTFIGKLWKKVEAMIKVIS